MTDTVPPWVDAPTLSRLICASDRTIDAWVAQGILPPPRKRGGKNLWRWKEVDEWLANGPPGEKTPDSVAERIRNAVKADIEAGQF